VFGRAGGKLAQIKDSKAAVWLIWLTGNIYGSWGH